MQKISEETIMKIIPESIIKINKDVSKKQNQGKDMTASSESAPKTSAGDKITIASNQVPALTDAEFIAQLKKTILSEIQAGAPEHKLADLRQQIALDEYDINIPDIVKKIMLDSTEASYE